VAAGFQAGWRGGELAGRPAGGLAGGGRRERRPAAGGAATNVYRLTDGCRGTGISAGRATNVAARTLTVVALPA
jgi:hypothetical protein